MLTKTTIREVATRAGVSVTTVSHALNDAPGTRVSAATRQRIRGIADELGYRPNRVAQSLRTQRTHTIGFLSDNIATTPYAGQLILGAQEAAAEAGSMLLLLSSGGDPELEDRELQVLLDRQVDGVVYASMFHRIVDPPAALARNPAVLLDARTSDGKLYSSVVPDEVGGARDAVEHLLAFGHRRIGFLNNSEDYPAPKGRLAGYRQALEVYGVPFDASLVVTSSPNTADAFDVAWQMLGRPDRPTALFCFNDRLAMGAYHAAREQGLAIPDDVSIIGFDDQQLIAANLRPGLTTMQLPHYEMGRWAVRTLFRQIKDHDTGLTHALLPCPLVRRASVTSPPRR